MNLISKKTLVAPALAGLMGLGMALPAQAFVVSGGIEKISFNTSSFDTGNSMFELAAGDYTMSLLMNHWNDDGGPSSFFIANTSAPETWKVTLTPSGLDQLAFTTVGGWFAWNVAGIVGSFSSYKAAIDEVAAVPLPPSLLMLGTAAAAMFSIRRRAGKTEATG